VARIVNGADAWSPIAKETVWGAYSVAMMCDGSRV